MRLGQLYLPDEKYKLTTKFATRIAKYFEQYYGMDYAEYYEELYDDDYYDIRSKIEHNGFITLDFEYTDNEKLIDILRITRLSILLYLKKKDIFSKNLFKTENLKIPDILSQTN